MRPFKFPPNGYGRAIGHRRAFTLVELIFASAISGMVAIALAGLTMTTSRLDKSTFYQQFFVRQSRTAIETLDREIRMAQILTDTTAPSYLTLSSVNGGTNNRVNFTQADGTVCSFTLNPGADGLLTTPADNTLQLTKGNTTTTVARWIVPTDGYGGFGPVTANMTTLVVGMRAGDPVVKEVTGSGQTHGLTSQTGIDIQGVDINLVITPRLILSGS